MQRTLNEFVEDMLSDGKSLQQIIAVARCTRWETRIEEIKEIVGKLRKKSFVVCDNIRKSNV